MKNKVVGVTKSIYELVRVLEEGEDVLNFTVFFILFSRKIRIIGYLVVCL